MSETRFIFESEQQQTLKHLQEYYGLRNMSEVLAKAISLLQLATEVEQSGDKLVIKSGERETKVDLS